jgi:hypothetical protein
LLCVDLNHFAAQQCEFCFCSTSLPLSSTFPSHLLFLPHLLVLSPPLSRFFHLLPFPRTPLPLLSSPRCLLTFSFFQPFLFPYLLSFLIFSLSSLFILQVLQNFTRSRRKRSVRSRSLSTDLVEKPSKVLLFLASDNHGNFNTTCSRFLTYSLLSNCVFFLCKKFQAGLTAILIIRMYHISFPLTLTPSLPLTHTPSLPPVPPSLCLADEPYGRVGRVHYITPRMPYREGRELRLLRAHDRQLVRLSAVLCCVELS